jgi:aspartate aminotransferase-like enzyme
VNLIELGDAVLIGERRSARMVDVAWRCGAQVDTVEAQWGMALDPAQFGAALEKNITSLLPPFMRDFHGCVSHS